MADYHAHVYFDADSKPQAADLCRRAGELFDLRIGRLHDRPVGPHPCPSCQLAFSDAQRQPLLDWLEQQRNGLTVLVHPCTGDDLGDHTHRARWLGPERELNTAIFESGDSP